MFSKKFTNTIIISLYFSLIIGFFLKEDLIGGAQTDYEGLYYLVERFRESFLNTFFNYDDLGHRQSPVFFILNSFIFEDENIIRLFYIHIFLAIPFFFYKCLKLLFDHVDKSTLKLLAVSLLLFPTIRSYSIWPDPHLMGFLFFILSIYYFLKFKKSNETFKYILLNLIFLSLAAYLSPNFGIFILYFFYEYFIKFNFSKKLFFIIIINIFLSIPFFYYIFFLDINFFINDNIWNLGENFYSPQNIANKIIIISSLFLFYLIPLINLKKLIKKDDLKIEIKVFLISIIIFFVSCYYFDFSDAYQLTNSGGGVFYNLSHFFFKNNYLLFFVTIISFYLLSRIFYLDVKNFIIFLCIILSNPQVTIWQANHSPTIFVLILLLFNINFVNHNLNKKNIIFIYAYLILFIFANFAKNLLI